MTDDDISGMLTTLGEAGGISAMVMMLLVGIVKVIQKKGCTCKLYTCSGTVCADVDCEEGAATKRYLPKPSSPPSEPAEAV